MRKFWTTAFAGVGAGLLTLLFGTSGADASAVRIPQRVVNAVGVCHPAPASARRACESLYLRPEIGIIPAGKGIVAECYDMARDESAPHTHRWNVYLSGCFRGNIATP